MLADRLQTLALASMAKAAAAPSKNKPRCAYLGGVTVRLCCSLLSYRLFVPVELYLLLAYSLARCVALILAVQLHFGLRRSGLMWYRGVVLSTVSGKRGADAPH